MRPADQAVDVPAMSRGQRRESKPLSHDALDAPWSFDHSLSRSIVSDALRALSEIEEEAHERALHGNRDAQQDQHAELGPFDHRGLLCPEAHRAGEDARAAANQHESRRHQGLPRRSDAERGPAAP